ncbi:hypothetical protein ILYODFUR_018609 [Ilyodon furcidens]|uniref:Uncharacterized protein n=1 Tax=Ilyodon furcidens TaxID=33524 RepID=A0ABV0TYH2_9TELE
MYTEKSYFAVRRVSGFGRGDLQIDGHMLFLGRFANVGVRMRAVHLLFVSGQWNIWVRPTEEDHSLRSLQTEGQTALITSNPVSARGINSMVLWKKAGVNHVRIIV